MAWQYVGGTTGVGTTNGYTVSLSGTLTGGIASSPATGDLIVVMTGFGNTAASAPNVTGNNSGAYVGVGTAIHANDTWDTEVRPFYRVVGATPDTSLSITRTASAVYGGATVVHVWRGVDEANPFIGVTQTSGTNGCVINPPAYNPAVADALIIAGGAGTMAATSNPYTAFTGMSNFITIKGDGTTSDTGTAMASFLYAGVSYDPPAVSGGTTSTSSSWGGFTFAFRMFVPAAQNLTPSRYDNTEQVFSPTVTTGAVSLTASRYDNDQVFYAADVTQPAGGQTLDATRYDNAQTYFTPTVTTGSVTLTANRLDNTNTFFTQTVTVGAVTLSPTRYDNPQVFYNLLVQSGATTLTALRFDNTNTLYAPTVQPGPRTLNPARLDNANTVYSASVTVGPVTLTASRFDNATALYAPTVTVTAPTLYVDLYANTNTFYAPTVSAGTTTLAASLYTNQQAFYSPTVSGAAVVLSPSRFDNTETLFEPNVVYIITFHDWVEPGWVEPGWVGWPYFNQNTFFSPTVTGGGEVTETLSFVEIKMLTDIWRRFGLDKSNPLVQTPAAVSCGLVLNLSGNNTVTVARQGVTEDFVSSHITIFDLWQRLGLDASNPLTIDSSSITSGGVSQDIVEAGTTTTVTRL